MKFRNQSSQSNNMDSERSTIDLIFISHRILEKCWERYQTLYTLLVEISKAFDTVKLVSLWKVLGMFVCFPIGSNIRMRAWKQSRGSTSGSFDVVSGLTQGCVLAPVLFNLYLTAIQIVAFSDRDAGVRMEYRTDGGCLISFASELRSAGYYMRMTALYLRTLKNSWNTW